MDIAPDSVTEAPPPGTTGPPAVVSIVPDSVTEAPPGLQPPPFMFTYIDEPQRVVGVINWATLLWSEKRRRGNIESDFVPSLAAGADFGGATNNAATGAWGEITGWLEFEYTGAEQAAQIAFSGGVTINGTIAIYVFHNYTAAVADPVWNVTGGTLLSLPFDFGPAGFTIPASVAKRVGVFIVLTLPGNSVNETASISGLIENLP